MLFDDVDIETIMNDLKTLAILSPPTLDTIQIRMLPMNAIRLR